MKFVSVRPPSSSTDRVKYTFEEAIKCGYADDGGMIVPEKFPKLTRKNLESWRKLSFPELTYEILKLFIDTDEIEHERILKPLLFLILLILKFLSV